MPMAFEAEPFNGDPHIGERIAELVAKHGVRTIVETGTYKGVTTLALSQIPRGDAYNDDNPRIGFICQNVQVVTIEKNPHYFAEAFAPLANVNFILADSAEVLPRLIPRLGATLFYLDAHWGRDWPLPDELRAIRMADRPVIVIHDFKVPGTDLGFDEYAGQALDWEYIREAVERIYGADGYVMSTNTPERAAGARRGVVYLEPK